MDLPLSLVDVFSPEPFRGNPVAVVHDADDVPADRMLAITRWLDLSESTFLLRPTDPGADYRVRIFTPAGELPFAGHPTLGSAHAWLEAGGAPAADDVVVQECGAGLVPVRRGPDGLAFAAPPLLRSGPVGEEDLARAVEVLGIRREDVVDAAWTDNGPGWLTLRLVDAAAVLAVRPAGAVDRQTDIGVVGLHPAGSEAAVEVRAFFTDQHQTLREDPVTGSLNAGVAQWLLGEGVLQAPYTASQGTALGRTGRPRITRDGAGAISVGGPTRTLARGRVEA